MFNGLNKSFYSMQSGLNGMNDFKDMLNAYMSGKKFSMKNTKQIKLVSGLKKSNLETEFTNSLVTKAAKFMGTTSAKIKGLLSQASTSAEAGHLKKVNKSISQLSQPGKLKKNTSP